MHRSCLLFANLSTLAMLTMVFLFFVSPYIFSMLSREDSVIEWLSFAFLLCASLLFAGAFVRLLKSKAHGQLARLFLICVAAALFVVSMEEVSWLQRTFDIETPELFGQNDQKELNFHNFATSVFENLYYIGGFIILNLVPFLGASGTNILHKSILVLIPSRNVAVSCIAMNAFNWDMWIIIPIQMTFWISVFLLLNFAQKNVQIRRPVLILLASMLLAQFVFLLFGDRLVRHWELTEYRETFIAFGFLVYAFEIFRRMRPGLEPTPS